MNSHARSLTSRYPRSLIIAALLALVTALAAASLWATRGSANAAEPIGSNFPSAPPVAPGGEVTTAGEISELDKTLLRKVRQANLWEAPAGRLAQTHASSEAVKRAGVHLMEGHSKLDSMVREAAQTLNVDIPDEATPEQLALVRKLQNSSGAEFDKLFANAVRAPHGKVFPVIAQVRATTKNSVIRAFASQANITVLDHQNVLDETGLVTQETYDEIAAAVVPQ
ncbi:DUF4142 domain-containing protein [Streptomyces apocyni]|uniref:DUF4142 domain-containing protein n=1 Tax=Streptomyces apocyni TaxID=2654677 RepID=UPI0012E99344|nr:DUF4142 domain-containing protein [Streptomyces apocyni]